MGFLINFLLISRLSFIIVETTSVLNIKTDILHLFSNGLPSVAVTKENNLKLLNGGELAVTRKSVVWKGIYNNKTKVACKIVSEEEQMDQEMTVFQALNATRNPNIEQHDIPRVYYHGKILDKYDAIAMTLFDETLYDRYCTQNESLSDLSILMIFKQAVKGLQYLNERNILHNDIKPDNIFLRGPKVFLGDFDLAISVGLLGGPFNEIFASSQKFSFQPRTSKSDLESLIYTIWFVANVPMCQSFGEVPEGKILSSLDKKAAKSRMLEKCKHFKNEHVYKAMRLICADELISDESVPNYERIIDALTEAIDKVKGNSDPPKFEWLTDNDADGSCSV